jgi:Ca2+-dependent lipid-binding protein
VVNNGNTASIYRSKVINSTLHPVWNEDGYVGGVVSPDSVLLLTMFDKDLVGADDFLGQVRRSSRANHAVYADRMRLYVFMYVDMFRMSFI